MIRTPKPSLFTPTRYKGAPRPCQLKLVVWIHVNVPMIVCVHVGTVAVRVQGMYCIVLHIWCTIGQLKYTQDCEWIYLGAKQIRDLRAVNIWEKYLLLQTHIASSHTQWMQWIYMTRKRSKRSFVWRQRIGTRGNPKPEKNQIKKFFMFPVNVIKRPP